MAVDLDTGDTSLSLPSQFLPDEDDDIFLYSQEHNLSTNNSNDGSALKPHRQVLLSPLVHSAEVERNDKDDDFIAELTRQMAHSMLQDDDNFEFSAIGSQNSEELPWDLIGSPQSTLWSTLGSNRGSPEGSSQGPSPPATPGNSQYSCWKNIYDVIGMFEKMMFDERSNSKNHTGNGNGIQNLKTCNIEQCSYEALIQAQIRAIQLSRLKQEQVLSLKEKLTACRESQGQISHQSEPKEEIQQFQKKRKGGARGVGSGNGRKTCSPRPASLNQIQTQQQASAGSRALFLDGSGSRGGTGFFLPRGGSVTSAPSKSTKKPGKGCSTVLIPARVVQALQLHFDQMAATSRPRAGGFPSLHDVLVSKRNGMYSLQKRQSRNAPAKIPNEKLLPQDWTY